MRPANQGGEVPHRPAHHGAFGNDRFGILAERFARFFGTPRFIIGQTILVALWIAINVLAVGLRWDPYPFILLNLAFSTQAAYAAPLILLAQTRQADRDKRHEDLMEAHHEAEEQRTDHFLEKERDLHEHVVGLLAQNTRLTEQVARLTAELHAAVIPSTQDAHGDRARGNLGQPGVGDLGDAGA
jgi:uncharacterized membrane protein